MRLRRPNTTHLRIFSRRFASRVQQSTLLPAFLFLTVVLFSGAFLLRFFEADSGIFQSLQDGLWWAVVTVTTVGYGDLVPQSAGGRLVGALVMFSGIVIISTLTAAISSMFVTQRLRELKGLRQITSKGHLLICGWNAQVEALLKQLRLYLLQGKIPVVLINRLEENEIARLKSQFSELRLGFVHGNHADEAILKRANANQADAAIILPDHDRSADSRADETTILATLSLKAMNNKIKVYVHIRDADNKGHLQRANADHIILSDAYSSQLLAAHVMAPGVPEFIEKMLSGASGQTFRRRPVPKSFHGKTYESFLQQVKKDEGMLVVGFVREEQPVQVDDILSGDYSAIDEFIRRKFAEMGKKGENRSRVLVNLNPPLDYVISPKDVAVLLSGPNVNEAK